MDQKNSFKITYIKGGALRKYERMSNTIVQYLS